MEPRAAGTSGGGPYGFSFASSFTCGTQNVRGTQQGCRAAHVRSCTSLLLIAVQTASRCYAMQQKRAWSTTPAKASLQTPALHLPAHNVLGLPPQLVCQDLKGLDGHVCLELQQVRPQKVLRLHLAACTGKAAAREGAGRTQAAAAGGGSGNGRCVNWARAALRYDPSTAISTGRKAASRPKRLQRLAHLAAPGEPPRV